MPCSGTESGLAQSPFSHRPKPCVRGGNGKEEKWRGSDLLHRYPSHHAVPHRRAGGWLPSFAAAPTRRASPPAKQCCFSIFAIFRFLQHAFLANVVNGHESISEVGLQIGETTQTLPIKCAAANRSVTVGRCVILRVGGLRRWFGPGKQNLTRTNGATGRPVVQGRKTVR